jgi:multicomponent Na+:H+ antiporter subunit G
MNDVVTLIIAVLVVLAGLFTLVAGIGMARLPDVYCRMHASSKAGTLGGGLVLIAAAVQSGSLEIAVHALMGLVFLLVTGPVAAHLLGRAAYMTGVPLWSGSQRDDLKAQGCAPEDALQNQD